MQNRCSSVKVVEIQLSRFFHCRSISSEWALLLSLELGLVEDIKSNLPVFLSLGFSQRILPTILVRAFGGLSLLLINL